MDQSQMIMSDDAVVEEEEDGLRFPTLRRKLEDDFVADAPAKQRKVQLRSGRDQMQVFLRVRPLTEEEKEKDEKTALMTLEAEHQTLTLHAPDGSNTFKNSQHGCGKQTHRFTFSKIFKETTTQKEFFASTVLNTVKDFIEGQNCLIFTYGVTNSGKTYTIQGNLKDGGILPRTLDVLFNSIEGRQWEDMSLKPAMFCDVMKITPRQEELEQKIKQCVLNLATEDEHDVTVSSLVGESDASRLTLGSQISDDSHIVDGMDATDVAEKSDKSSMEQLFKEAEERVREDATVDVKPQGQIRFSVWVTFAEIYNEYIYDLLEPIPKGKNARRPILHLREDKNGVPYAKGLKEVKADSADEAYKILAIGKKNLQMACTKLNHNSSRSHCIFTVKVLRVVDKTNPHMARVSMLSFCDLAGSERYSKTQSSGDRMKEAGNINTSLLSLGRCIKVLRHNQVYRDHPQIVPFRDSKLTRLFQSFFCGKGRACMIVNINQCASMFDETLHALKYSAIAKHVVTVQEAPKEKKEKPVQRSHRLVSLALAQNSSKGPRPTIGFATPGTLLKILKEEEEVAASVPVPSFDEDLEDDLEEESKEEMMMRIIDKMKAELLQEKEKNLMQEWSIREEVCQEMQQQLVTIESEFEDRLRCMQDRMEERSDTRINLLRQSVKKRKLATNDDDEEVDPEAVLKSRNTTVKKLDEQVGELKRQVTQLKQQLVKAEMASSTVTAKGDAAARTSVMEQLQQKLADYRAQMGSKEKEINDLNEMLSEAGETFKDKEEDIQQLQNTIDAYESKYSEQEKSLDNLARLLEETQAAFKEANKQLRAKDEQITRLKSTLTDTSNKECPSCQEQVVRLGEVVSKLADTEAEVDKLNADFVRCQHEATQKGEAVRDLEKQLAEKEELRANLNKDQTESSKVPQLLEQVKKLEKELTESQDKVQEEGRRSLDLEGKVSALEQSLQAANSCLRNTTLEAATVSESLEKVQQNLLLVEEKHKKCKPCILDLQKQLDDYILKVNEQAEEVGNLSDKFTFQKQKCSELETRVSELEGSSLEKDEELVNLRNKAQDLETRLKAERKQQKSAGSELDELLQSKAIIIEELTTKVTHLSSQLRLKDKKLTQTEGDIKTLNLKFTQSATDLESVKKKLDDSKTTLSEMKSEAEEAAKTLGDAQKKLAESQKKETAATETIAVQDNKISSLQVSLEIAEEQGEELMEVRVALERSNEQYQLLVGVVDGVQKELDTIKAKQKNLVEPGPSKVTEKCMEDSESLLQKIRQLESDVSEAQYSAQINSRTLRREKTQVEHRLKETEEELALAQKKIADIEEQINSKSSSPAPPVEDSGDIESLRKELEEQTRKASRLDGIVQDLEDCLKSSKSSQQAATETAESYKQKYRALEEETVTKDDRLQSLECQLEEVNTDKERDIKANQQEIEKLNESVCDLEHKCKEYRSGMETLEARLSYIGLLEEKNDSILSELEERDGKVKEVSDLLQEAEEKVKTLEGDLTEMMKKLETAEAERTTLEKTCSEQAEKNEKLEKEKAENDAKAEELSAKCKLVTELESVVHEERKQSATLGKQVENLLKEELTAKDTLGALRADLEVKDKNVRQLEEQLEVKATLGKEHLSLLDELEKTQKREKEVHKQLQEASKMQEQQNMKFNALEDKLRLAQEEAEAQTAGVCADKRTISSLQLELESVVHEERKQSATLGKQVENLLKEELTAKDTLRALRADLEVKDKKVRQLEEQLEVKATLGKEHLSLLDELEKTQKREKEVHKQLQEASKMQEQQNMKINALEDKLRLAQEEAEAQTAGVRADKRTISSLQLELESVVHEERKQSATLGKQVENLLKEELTAKDTLGALRADLEVKDKKVRQLEEQLEVKATLGKEHLSLLDELEKTQKREKEVHKQLQEASKMQEQQNMKFNALEDKLRLAQEEAEAQTAGVRADKRTISSLQDELSGLRAKVDTTTEEHSSKERRLVAETESLIVKIRWLEGELEKKDQKVRERSKNVKELMEQIDSERNSVDIKLQDARANEAVLAQLKQSLEDQDVAFELQEQKNTQTEEELAALRKDHKTLHEKFIKISKETDSRSNAILELETKLKTFRGQKQTIAEAEAEAHQLKINAEHSEKARAQLKHKLEETNREMREMEKLLSDLRKEVGQLKERLFEKDESQSKPKESNNRDEQHLAILKTKFTALETAKKHLEKEQMQLKNELNSTTAKNEEDMNKFREDRDGLVSQLEKILTAKEAERATLQHETERLGTDVKDRDAIIAALAQQLDDSKTPSKSQRVTRHRQGGDDDDLSLRSQLEEMRQAHSQEIGRVVKAKDRIIEDLKSSNHKLQARVPGSESLATEDKDAPTKRGTRATKGLRKRQSSETEDPMTKTPSRRKTGRTQASSQQVLRDENLHDIMPIQEEDVVDLDHAVTSTSAKRHALADTLNTSGNAGDHHTSTFISPAKSSQKLEAPQSGRSRRHLRSTFTEPFSESPPLTPSASTPSKVKDNSQEIVMRKLRTRKKVTNV